MTLLNPTDPTSYALVAGGFSKVGGNPLASAELYDPLSRRFSPTGSMSAPRAAHTATLLAPLTLPPTVGPELPVLIAGGVDAAGTPLASLDVYDPASGVFVPDGNAMTEVPRYEHAAVLIGDGEVLLAGGTSLPLNQPTNRAYLYKFTSFAAGSPPSSARSSLVLLGSGSASNMLSPRTALTATRLGTGQVLLAGGLVLAGGRLQALQTAELYDRATTSFGPVQPKGKGNINMLTSRGYHTATALASGEVLIAGGRSSTATGANTYTSTIDLYLDGTKGTDVGFLPQPAPITMSGTRSNHSATLLPDGRVLIAGGFSADSAIDSAEIFSPVARAFSNLGAPVPMVARGDHAALLVNTGGSETGGHTVIVTGGSTSPGIGAAALASAQLLKRIEGDPCSLADECLSGFCADGVCCDKACTEECYACSKTTTESGTDGACTFAKRGSDPHQQCINELETHTACDGKGSTEDEKATHDCKPGTCDAMGFACSTSCRSTADCSDTGWCDRSESAAGRPQTGTCQPKKGLGETCDGDNRCKSAFCVDGVCCNRRCDSPCEACDLPGSFAGTCSRVGSSTTHSDVHPGGLHPRKACDGFVGGARTSCTGYCADDTTCQYPDATSSLGEKDCTDDPAGGLSTLVAHPCDAKGGATDVPGDCGQMRCADAHACNTTCAKDEDCIADFGCSDGACVSLDPPLCDGKDTLRRTNANGGYEKCAEHYACRGGEHACLKACDSASDCVDGLVCDGTRRCVVEPRAPRLPGCSLAPDARGAPWWAVGAAAAVWMARRRRRRSDSR